MITVPNLLYHWSASPPESIERFIEDQAFVGFTLTPSPVSIGSASVTKEDGEREATFLQETGVGVCVESNHTTARNPGPL
jgi:hypothetical protein